MAPKLDEQREKLNRLLEISALQRRLVSEKRIDDLLQYHAEREALFATIDLTGSSADGSLKELAHKLSESDSLLMAETRALMEGMSARLNHLKAGQSALRAYGSPKEKRTLG